MHETPDLEVAGGVVESPLGCPGTYGEVFGMIAEDLDQRFGAAGFASAQLRGVAAPRAEPGLGRGGAALGGPGDPHGAVRPSGIR